MEEKVVFKFYRLTGWYFYGHNDYTQYYSDMRKAVAQYMNNKKTDDETILDKIIVTEKDGKLTFSISNIKEYYKYKERN